MSEHNRDSHLFLPQHGHYRQLRVYKVAEALYDLTFIFCRRFLPAHGDRTVDQMIQAARSGKQNIAEGNQAATTSAETEIKLTNVARASIEELLADYEDYLRTRNLQQWAIGYSRLEHLRQWVRSDSFFKQYATYAERMQDEELVNLCITLCHQVNYMLGQLLKTMQERFVTEGGIKEQMHATRTGYRRRQTEQLEALQKENAALRQRIAQLEAHLSHLTTPSTQNSPSNQNNLNNLNNLNNQSNQSTPITPTTPTTPITPTTPTNNTPKTPQ